MNAIDAIFYIVILIMSVVVHEVSHGFMAERFGDNTARLRGRLTLNPLRHLEWFGSVILPALLILSKAGFVFGWARPVPYDPDNLNNRRWGTLAVAAAGILMNFLVAILFGLILRFSAPLNFSPDFYYIISVIVVVNLALGIFNLVPVPPLDGSKILFSILPQSWEHRLYQLEQYSLILLVVFIVFFSKYLSPVLALLFRLITGVGF